MSTTVLASKVEAVRLYHRGATVQRRAELILDSGRRLPLEVSIPGLPLALHDATVRVRLAADAAAGADLLASDLRVGLHVKPRAAVLDVPALDELRVLDRRIELLETEHEGLSRECELLESIEVPARPEPRDGEPPPPAPLGARMAIAGFVASEVDQRVARLRALRLELEEAREAREDLRARLDRVDASRRVAADEVTKVVTVRLRGAVPEGVARLPLVVEYFVDGARWAPQYQCRIARDGSRAAIQLRALVCQRTGEDWRGVRLELSTADALAWTELPRLASLRIGRAQPTPAARPGFRPPPQGGRTLFGDYDLGVARARALVPSLSAPQPAQPAQPLALKKARAAEVMRIAAYESDEAEEESLAVRDEAPAKAAPSPSSRSRDASAPPPPAPSAFGAPPGGAPLPRPQPAPVAGGQARAEAEGSRGAGFAELRLPAADDATRRGRLVPLDRRAAYEGSLAESGLELAGLDVVALVEAAEASARAASHATLPSGAVDVRSVAGVFDYAYVADATVEVASDGSFHSVPVGVREGGCALEYVVVPRHESHVYRVAFIDNPLSAPLLPGSAELYVGDEYVLTTTLPVVAPRERFRLGLGVEQAIKCARNTRFAETRSGSAVVATSELEHTITIELVNNLPRAARVEVRERVPQPAPDAEVVVEEAQVEPAWEAYDQAERGRVLVGGRRWRVELAPGERRTLAARYVVKIYAQNEIVGGNRREV